MAISPLQRNVSAADLPPERLAANSTLTDKEKIAEASRQFEAILLRQILDASQKTVIPSKFADNSTASSIYRDLVTNQLANAISKSGSFGLAGIFDRQLNHPGSDQSDDVPEEPTASRTTASQAAQRPPAETPIPARSQQLMQKHSDLSRPCP